MDKSKQAFPISINDSQIPAYEGMTLREHYAWMAMQGLLAASINMCPYTIEVAYRAVEHADALLAELTK
jgi:hypothetical protein